ncbi:MAG: hypothetical protein ABI054_13415 [Planctomycetota bacterium]
MKTPKAELHTEQIKELLFQALETERGGLQIYRTALLCVRNEDLEEEWEEYQSQTENHVSVLTAVLQNLGHDPEASTPGCKVVKHIGESLVAAMEKARAGGDPAAAELVAAECVVLAETKDHLNWHLIGKLADALPAAQSAILREAYDEVEDEEDEHLYHSGGWARELWLNALGLPAILPPPEEEADVESALEAAQAQEESEANR